MSFTLAKLIYDLYKIGKDLIFVSKFRTTLAIGSLVLFVYYAQKWYYEIIDTDQVFTNINIVNNYDDSTQSFLTECKDKISFSLLAVSTRPKEMISSPTGKAYKTKFAVCNAFDKKKGGFVDLRNQESLVNGKLRLPYKNTYYVSTAFADTLTRLSDNVEPYVINTQYPESIPSDVKQFLEQTEWYTQGIMHTIYITSVINEREQLIYILTVTSAEPNPNCDPAKLKNFLSNLKDKMIS